MAKTKLNGWVKIIAITSFILGLAGAIAGFAWDASTKSSAILRNTDEICVIKTETVPKARQNEMDISNVQSDMKWLIEGQELIIDEQKEQRKIQMQILQRLSNE